MLFEIAYINLPSRNMTDRTDASNKVEDVPTPIPADTKLGEEVQPDRPSDEEILRYEKGTEEPT